MLRSRSMFTLVSAAALLAGSAQADVLAGWEFAGQDFPTGAPTTVDAALGTVTNLSVSPGLLQRTGVFNGMRFTRVVEANAAGSNSSDTPFASGLDAFLGNGAAGPVDPDYVSFTVTPNGTIDIESIDVHLSGERETTVGGNTGVYLFSSLTGNTLLGSVNPGTADDVLDSDADGTYLIGTLSVTDGSIALGSAFDAVSAPVTFYLAFVAEGSGVAGSWNRFDHMGIGEGDNTVGDPDRLGLDLVVNAVPEPGMIGLGLAGLGAMAARRRK